MEYSIIEVLANNEKEETIFKFEVWPFGIRNISRIKKEERI
jgi:hypothetical protein